MDSTSTMFGDLTSGSYGESLAALVLHADPIVQATLLILVLMSVMCWAIILQKWFRIRVAQRQSEAFQDMFWKTRQLDQVYEATPRFPRSPVAAQFRAAYRELDRVQSGRVGPDPETNIARALRRAAQAESSRLERYVAFLATTGSTAPFIGLFGTVWGILQAFLKLGQPGATATLQVVGPDIAHALVATAVGLVAAIPAVMAYNYFHDQLRILHIEMDNFSSDFLNIVKRAA